MLITYVYKYMSYSEKYDDIFVYISFDKKNYFFFIFFFLNFKVPFDGTAGDQRRGQDEKSFLPDREGMVPKSGEILEVLKQFNLYIFLIINFCCHKKGEV